jgi:hypothetical protein
MTDTLITDTFTTVRITAAELRPGDIRIDIETGDRMHAAFDVQVDKVCEGYTTVWTATSDQAKGEPDEYLIPNDFPVFVARRDGGPRTTRTVLEGR